MKGALRGKTLVIFATVGLLVLFTCWAVLVGARQAERRKREMVQVATFQLQVKELQLLASRLARGGDGEDLSRTITDGQPLTRAIEALGQRGAPWAQGSPPPTLSNQLESLRQAFRDLSALHGDKAKTVQTHQALLDLVEQRVAALALDLSSQIQPRFDTFRHLLARVQQEGRARQSLAEMKTQAIAIEGLVSDPAILGTMNRLLAEAEEHGDKEAAIKEGAVLLERLAATFASTAKDTVDGITRALAREQARTQGLVLSLFTVLALAILLSFLFCRRAIGTFQATLSQARSLISAAHPAYPSSTDNRDDEPGVTLHRIEEAVVALQETKQALSASHRRFAELTAAFNDWVWMVDRHGVCTYSRKPSAWREIDLDDHQAVGQPLAKLLEGAVDTPIAPALQTALAKEAPVEPVVAEWHLANGRTIPFATSGHPLLDAAGRFQGLILISRDLTDQRRTETELAKVRQANSFLNQVLELALLDIKIPELLDRFLKLLTDCAWLGAQPSAAFFMIERAGNSLVMTAHRGLDLDIQRSCAVLPLGTCLCGRAAQTGKVIFAESGDDRHEMSYHGMAVHGHYCLPVHTVAGEIIGVVALYLNPDCKWDGRDESILTSATTMIGSIIRRRQAEDGLKELNQDLERRIEARTAQLTAANKELDAFAYSVSHDLRAPLRAIDGFSQALAEDFAGELSSEAHGYLERIRAGCGRMGSLINDLLRLSRLTRSDLDWQTLDLSKMATEISKELAAESPLRVVEWRIAPNLTAEGDPSMIRAVLDNLLGNAWKYSAKATGARIEFGAMRLGQEEAFFVRDNGAGFDMRYADKLFKAFQRLHSASQFAGNGIGLATVQRIIHRHGGRIWAQGQVDQGATFTFTLGRPELKG